MLSHLRTAQYLAKSILFGLLLLPIIVSAQSNGQNASDVIAQIKQQQKTVVTFAGYSGAGYQQPELMLEQAAEILEQYDPKTTLINIGATADGIGAIYPLAKKRHFSTIGIVSTQALESNTPVSPAVDQVFYITDTTWGGLLSDSSKLSPTSEAMVNSSDVFIAIGGGSVTRDEYLAAQALGKKVQFIAAEMDHKKAIEKAQRKGLSLPNDFRGDVEKALATH